MDKVQRLALRRAAQARVAQQRAFTRYPQQSFVNRHFARPQLPYLSQPSNRYRLSPIDRQVLRLISTRNRKAVKDYLWLIIKWGVISQTILTLGYIAFLGVTIEIAEAERPTPDEWSWKTRQAMRAATAIIERFNRGLMMNWPALGHQYLKVIANLEDPTKDGKGVKEQQLEEDGGSIMIADVGSVGLDVTEKSWQWRQGYFQALMGMARCSEGMEEWVRDTSRDLIFPKSVMIGPSNPDPRPPNDLMSSPPLEENCVRPFPPPETYYMRILTGLGFTNEQKLDAAWAYANWLDFSGALSAAEEMYKWAIDISKQPLADSDNVLDAKTYVLTPSKSTSFTLPSSNLLKSLTLLGVQRARTGDTSSALAILASVLRARQAAPVDHSLEEAGLKQRIKHKTDIASFMGIMSILFTPTRYPPPPPSGDEVYMRREDGSCDESELMLYIGEILFAATPKSQDGLRWTKKSVELTQQGLDSGPVRDEEDKIRYKKCQQCLKTGAENWSLMLASLPDGESGKSGWFTKKAVKANDADLNADLLRIAELERTIDLMKIDGDPAYSRRSAVFGMFPGAG